MCLFTINIIHLLLLLIQWRILRAILHLEDSYLNRPNTVIPTRYIQASQTEELIRKSISVRAGREVKSPKIIVVGSDEFNNGGNIEPEAEPMGHKEQPELPPFKEYKKKISVVESTKKEWDLAGSGLRILKTGMMKLLSLPKQVSYIFSKGFDLILNGGGRKKSIR